MKIQEIEIDTIKPYSKNPRKNDNAVDVVKNSLKEFGWKQPLVINPITMEIVVGHTRWKAAKALEFKTVPCVMADDLTDEQMKAYRLADNKTNEFAEWDFDLLGEEIESLLNIDITDLGFTFEADIEKHEVMEDSFEVEAELKNIEIPITKSGDIWQLGRHKLLCDDSTDCERVALFMSGHKADLLLTDPPYNVNYEGKTKDRLKMKNDNMSEKMFFSFLIKAMQSAISIMKDGASFYIWHADSSGGIFRNALKEIGLNIRQCLIWVKNTFVLGRQDYQWQHEPCLYGWKDGAAHYWGSDRKQSTLLNYNRPQKNKEHPTMKPVKMFDYLICNSTKKGDLVIDLFLGGGTTLIACEQNGRTCYGIEIDPRCCDVIVKRWENLTGGKAILVNGK
jgi:site-specific DNA-methyltransferase (adenine-specific)